MLSVILVNWNGASDTIACIESLLAADRALMRIIVVDNDSPNNSLEVLTRWAGTCQLDCQVQFGRYLESDTRFLGFEGSFEDSLEQLSPKPFIYIVESGRNGGFGFGCNIGMLLADRLGTDSYWLLNNDCVVNEKAVVEVAKAVENHPDTVFGTIVRYFAAPHAVQVYGGGSFSKLTGKNVSAIKAHAKESFDYIYGASMIFSDRARLAIGNFDEKIFMYYEEMDFCLRAQAAGFDFDVVTTDVFHKHGGSQGGVSSAAWANVLKNKYYVLNKHFGWGFWTLVYFASLFIRCVLPIGGKRASIGARAALKALLSKEVQPCE